MTGVYQQKRNGKLFYLWKHRPIVVLSGSMEPELLSGSVVLVKKTKEIKKGDVLFFFTEEEVPVLHRFCDRDKAGNIITKGDANQREDFEHIRPEKVEGKVVLRMNWLAPLIRLFGINRTL